MCTSHNPQDSEPEGLVIVGSCYQHSEADLARIRLEGAGIDVFLENEFIVMNNPLYGPATGGIKLLVPSSQAEEALEMLAEDRKVICCPACGSEKVARKTLPLAWFVMALMLLALPLWLFNRPWYCEECGHEWK